MLRDLLNWVGAHGRATSQTDGSSIPPAGPNDLQLGAIGPAGRYALADVATTRPAGATTLPLEFTPAGIDLSLDGRPLGHDSFHARPGWDEMVLRIPAGLVTREASRLDLKGRDAAFRYWLYQ